MPQATPQELRQRLWDLAQQGLDVNAIAQQLQLPRRTVRRLLAGFRSQGQPTPPRFDRCGRTPSEPFAQFRDLALELRREHLHWGAERIRAHWRCQPLQGPLPDPSTVRRWLATAGLAPQRRTPQPPTTPTPLATRVHQIWPMDAAEQKKLATGGKICWLRLLDEASGAVLFTEVFNQSCWADVGGQAVQASLRRAFVRWGRPEGLRVDNGNPWVRPDSDLPSVLELWLVGLGVALHKGRPGVPQDNSRIERSQRTAQDWAEPGKQASAEALQRRLDEEDRIQREVYLFDGKRSRLEAYPELRLLGRPYQEGFWEEVCWDQQEALACLGRLELQRRVDKDGYVSLYDQRPRVGSAYREQEVGVRFCPASQEWVFVQNGQQISRCPAAYLSAAGIRALQIGRRPGRSAKRTRQRLAARQASASAGSPAEPVSAPPALNPCSLDSP